MKNSIFIDIDTEREKPILFGKPPEITPPETKEEAAQMILNDIACLAESLTTLILMAEQNEYGKKTELVEASIKTLSTLLNETKNTEDEHKG